MRVFEVIAGMAAAIAMSATAQADTDISATNPRAAAAIAAVKQLCLAGTQFDLKADVSGNLTLLKLAPGANGAATVNVRNSTGAAAIFDDRVRQVADEDIRKCIMPQINRIIDAILTGGTAPAATYTWVDRPSSTQPPLGPFGGCRCAAILNTDSGIKVTNGCNGDLPVTAVRGNWTPPTTPAADPRVPWALTPTAGREYANLTLAAGNIVTFDNAKQVFLWHCPNM